MVLHWTYMPTSVWPSLLMLSVLIKSPDPLLSLITALSSTLVLQLSTRLMVEGDGRLHLQVSTSTLPSCVNSGVHIASTVAIVSRHSTDEIWSQPATVCVFHDPTAHYPASLNVCGAYCQAVTAQSGKWDVKLTGTYLTVQFSSSCPHPLSSTTEWKRCSTLNGYSLCCGWGDERRIAPVTSLVGLHKTERLTV